MTPEQTPSEVPETPEEVAVDNETKGRRISVEAAADELRRLDDLGPDSDEVKKWLADNGITENDQIVANGNVYVANSKDFLTRDVAATEEWAASARSIVDIEGAIDQHTAEIAEEEPRVSAELAEEYGEATLDAAGVEEPVTENEPISASMQDIMSGESKGPLKFDIEASVRKLEEKEAKQLIPKDDLRDAQMMTSGLLDGIHVAYQHPGPDGEQQLRNMDRVAVGNMDSVLTRVRNGNIGLEAAAFEIGVLLASARSYDAADALLQKVYGASDILSPEQLEKITDIGHTIREAGLRQGEQGGHFAAMGYDLDMRANNRLESNDQKPDAVYAAIMGAGVGVYLRVGAEHIGTAYARLNGAMDHLRHFEK